MNPHNSPQKGRLARNSFTLFKGVIRASLMVLPLVGALSSATGATTNFVWNASKAMLYDTNYVNNPTALSDPQFQLNNSAGSLTLNNGTLTLSNTTWGAFIGQNATSAFTNNGGTLRWYATGANEQRFAIGNGPNNGGGKGTVLMAGGFFEIFTEGGTDSQRNWAVGRDRGTGTLIINNGMIWGHTDRVTFGGQFNADGSFTANATGTVTLGLGHGIFRLSGLSDLSTASMNFNPNGNSFINFVLGSKGEIQIQNATLADYQNWVNNGWMRLNGQPTTVDILSYTNDGTYGILKLVDMVAGTPVFSPTNNVFAGEAVTASSTASGSGALSYKWQTDGGTGGAMFTDIPGATSTNYVIDTTGLYGAYQYRMVVTSGSSSFTGAAATLTVNAASAPFLTADITPASVSRYVGGAAVTFTAAFEGNHPISYQWQKDGGIGFTNIPGQTNASLTISNIQFASAGSYMLTAANSLGGNTSTPATLTVLDPAGLQFTWSAPVPFGGLNADQILTNVSGGLVGAAVFGNTAPIAVTLSSGQVVTFKNDGSVATSTGAGTATGAYPAATTNTTGNANLDAVLNQFRFDNGPHTITLNNLVIGERYAVQLFALDNRVSSTNRLCNFQDGDDPAITVETSATIAMGDNAYIVGTFTASNSTETITQNLPTDNAGNINALVLRALSFVPSSPAVILTQPTSVSAFVGHTARFTVGVDGVPTPSIQWQRGPVGGPYANVVNGGRISGATSPTLVISNLVLADASEFVAVVTNSQNSVTSSAADLTVLSIPPGSGTNGTALLALKPVAYWPLNETTDPSVGGVGAYDAAGDHDGTYGAAAQNAANSIYGPQATDGFAGFATGQGALGLNGGANSWVTTPALNLNTNTVTITCWVNPNGTQYAFSGLLMNRNANQPGGLHFRDNNELGYTWVINDSTQWGHSTGLFVPTNQWSFCALVVTPTNTTWYLYNTTNGMRTHSYDIANPVMPWTGDSSLIRIGSDAAWAPRVVNGIIDEVAVFNYSLSSNQVAAVAGLAGLVNTDPVTAHFTASRSGQSLNFSWAPDHQGWQLYTNAVGLAATNSWYPVPGSGSATSQTITVDPTKPAVFFQLRYP